MKTTYGDRITDSFERAAQRCDDLTPLVYQRLFRDHPAMRELFVLDTDGAVKGSMLEHCITSILDLVDSDHYGRNLIRTEAVNHVRNGVSASDFPIFFRTVADTMRDVLAEDWTPDTAAAWRDLLIDLDTTVSSIER